MNTRGLLRMAKWARKPPSEKQIKMVFGIVVICLFLFGIDRAFGWPEWLTPDRIGR